MSQVTLTVMYGRDATRTCSCAKALAPEAATRSAIATGCKLFIGLSLLIRTEKADFLSTRSQQRLRARRSDSAIMSCGIDPFHGHYATVRRHAAFRGRPPFRPFAREAAAFF